LKLAPTGGKILFSIPSGFSPRQLKKDLEGRREHGLKNAQAIGSKRPPPTPPKEGRLKCQDAYKLFRIIRLFLIIDFCEYRNYTRTGETVIKVVMTNL
jgi:hypothetical protein